MTPSMQDVLDAISAAGAADAWKLADEIATEHGLTGCRMCLVAKRVDPTTLPPSGYSQHPDVEKLFCVACFVKYLEQRVPVHTTVQIYARPNGCDATGDGTRTNPYLTLARAQRDIPVVIPSGYRYEIAVV
jgi:hypothetical protein